VQSQSIAFIEILSGVLVLFIALFNFAVSRFIHGTEAADVFCSSFEGSHLVLAVALTPRCHEFVKDGNY
jgi:hypothetical protein